MVRVKSVRLPERYHIVAMVYLVLIDEGVLLDESEVFLVPPAAIEQNRGRLPAQCGPFRISQSHVDVCSSSHSTACLLFHSILTSACR